MKKLVIIENGQYEYNTLKEMVRELIADNYYELSEEEKMKKMKMKGIANCIANRRKVVKLDEITPNYNLDEEFIIGNEIVYVLSLLVGNNIILMEKVGADIFTKNLDIEDTGSNYIIVNKFAKKILKNYIDEKILTKNK